MNPVRSIIAQSLLTTCGLALALSGAPGCKAQKPDGTNPPGENEGKGKGRRAKGGGDGGGDGGGGEGDSGGGAEAAKACTAKVADRPTLLFDDRVLLRPPVNVEIEMDNPTFATTRSTSGYVSACEKTVDQMNMFIFGKEPKKTVKQYADEFYETLGKQGYTGGTRSDAYVDKPTQYDFSAEYPAAGGQPPLEMYMSVRHLVDAGQGIDNIFIIIYKTRPDEFDALKPTFTESAATLLVVPAG